ncbi:MAG: hypothetical protein DMF84_10315 [Acidobacteria bacterium]|nr:MAG: hypothetical protein DMF84_10315 [Acidobacteriota bacterium]
MAATAELQDIVLAAMTAANLTRPEDSKMLEGAEAPIVGPGSPLDCLGLVSLRRFKRSRVTAGIETAGAA